MQRRTFLNITALSAAGTLTAPKLFGNPYPFDKINEIGIQVYSVRQALRNDFAGTLSKLAAIGYNYVELFAYNDGKYFGIPVKEVKNILDGEGLKVRSSHTGTGVNNPNAKGTLTTDWERAVEDAKTLGQEYIVCAYLQDFERKTLSQYQKNAELFNKSAEVCKKYDLQFAYHNHAFEFIEIDGQIPFDLLLKETDENLVQIELDLYWINKAGKDPIEYFKNFPGRFPLWHVKDMDNTEEKFFTEVGNGVIDWKKIFKNKDLSGMKYLFVEQDRFKNNRPFESVEISYKYLKNLEY